MTYRGEDMDLRVPAGRGPSGRGPGGRGEAGPLDVEALNASRWSRPAPATLRNEPHRAEPLWVDEVVLACCNHAYDLALAHGATEVRIEHLLHAMTRVEAAAEVLESRGIREAHLRRESAALISSEGPLGLGGDRGAPRRAPELEDAIRAASGLARRHGTAAAGVGDLLAVLLASPRETPVIAMLRRFAPDWARRDRVPAPDPRSAPPDPRVEQLMLAEPVSSRLDAIDATMRAIHAEIAGDRRLLADAIRDLQRDLLVQRGDASGLANTISERLQSFERTLVSRVTESTHHLQPVAERMASLERAVQSGLGEGARNWAALGQHITRLEGSLDRPVTADLAPLAEPVIGRIDSLDATVRAGLGEGARNWAGLSQRLVAIETTITSQLETRAADTVRGWTAMADRVQALERAVHAQGGEAERQWSMLVDAVAETRAAIPHRGQEGGSDGTALAERLAAVERSIRSGLGDAVRAVSLVGERLAVVESAVNARDGGEATLILDERIRTLEGTIEGRARETGGRWMELVQRFDGLDRRLTDVRLTAPSTAPLPAATPAQRFDPEIVTAPLLAEVGRLAQAAEARQQATARAMAEIGGRIAALEQVAGANATAHREVSQSLEQTIAQLHDGLVRLSENQVTLASAMKEWRSDNKQDLSVIADRLEPLAGLRKATSEIEAGPSPAAIVDANRLPPTATPAPPAAAAPAPATASKAPVVTRSIQTATPARGHGFWWWLFGTSNVRQANRDAELRWKSMHQRLRTARDRMRERA